MGVKKGGTIDDYDPIYFGIPRKAVREWIALSEAVADTYAYPCNKNPYYYTDYEGYKPLSVDVCESLCEGCPLLKLCYDFAVASDQENGIWGGVSFYKNMVCIDDQYINIESGNNKDPNSIF